MSKTYTNEITAVSIHPPYPEYGINRYSADFERYSPATADEPRRRLAPHHRRDVTDASAARLLRTIEDLASSDGWRRSSRDRRTYYKTDPKAHTPAEIMAKYPRLTAHVICHSLGYATPEMAASIIAAAHRGNAHYCEWINYCYHDDPRPAVRAAVRGRHTHKGYMADYKTARLIVAQAIAGNPPMLASWF